MIKRTITIPEVPDTLFHIEDKTEKLSIVPDLKIIWFMKKGIKYGLVTPRIIYNEALGKIDISKLSDREHILVALVVGHKVEVLSK